MYLHMAVYVYIYIYIFQNLKTDQKQKPWGWLLAHRDGSRISYYKGECDPK